MERRSTTTTGANGARVARGKESGTGITDGRSRAKRVTRVTVTKRPRNGASKIENTGGRTRPSEEINHPHPMRATIRAYVVRRYLARESRCMLRRMRMIWCEKRPEKNCYDL